MNYLFMIILKIMIQMEVIKLMLMIFFQIQTFIGIKIEDANLFLKKKNYNMSFLRKMFIYKTFRFKMT